MVIFRSPEVKATVLIEINADELATIREGLRKLIMVSYNKETYDRAEALLRVLPKEL